ncbi:MAG: AAA family ATPase [Chloroflexi bacterium]|nr:AAA family ATPase [Chloroflexota bacterium]
MTCGNCGTENRPGRKFCSNCGTALALGCPSCSAPYEPGERFCGECGTALPASAAPVSASAPRPSPVAGPETAAERKLVSVLFADLVGFTPFAEERDAEDVRETLTKYFDLTREVIERYGGTVEKFIGDAVMALWGAPVAREDDAERAVRAALDLVGSVRGLGPHAQLRAAVLTGEAAVTIGATNQGMVAGDIVNTASRLQSAAPPGRVLVGESTFRAASKAIAFEEAGDQVLKGKSAPVAAWLALRVVAERGGRGRSEGLEAPFVGREDELRLLKDLYHAAARERRSRLVSLIGPGGIGKSRLAWEFEKYLDGIVGLIWWHHGRSPAYGQGISFWALGEMIRGRAKIAETADEATTRAGIAAMVAQHIPDEAERRWIESALLALLGISGGDLPADQLFAAWRTFFERLTATGPVVLVFEDLHWADSGLLDFIDHLLEWSRDQPIYVLTLARPDLLEKRPEWGAARRNFLSLSLEPLSPAAMAELLGGLIRDLPEPTLKAIIGRADGIPLYAVETVRMLVADGRLRESDGAYEVVGDISTLAVPESLTALISARLDALDPSDRALLQDAAVLGQSFTVAGLVAVTGRDAADIETRLSGLVRREILAARMDARSPERGQYAFVQALIREVAYNTLTKKDRRERHLAAARFFESLGNDELAGALAGHYLSAHENSPAGPEADGLAIQARIALTGAADRAAALGSHLQAFGFLSQALAIETDVARQPELLERAAIEGLASGSYQRSLEFAEQLLTAYTASGDRIGELRATILKSRALGSALRTEESAGAIDVAMERFADLEGRPEHVELLLRHAQAHWLRDRLVEAVAAADRALEAAERADILPSVVDGLVVKGGALGYLGRGYEGISMMRGALALAETNDYTLGGLRATVNLADAQISRDPRAALETARAGLVDVRRLGRVDYLGTMTINGAYGALRTGDWEWATRECIAAEDAAIEDTDRVNAEAILAILDAGQGRSAEERLAGISRVIGATSDQQSLAVLRDAQANVALAEGRLDDAHDLALETATLMAWLAPTSFVTAARSALWQRDAERAAEALARLDASTHGPAISAAKAEIDAGLLALDGPRPAAIARYREAIQAWRDLGLAWDEAVTAIDMATLLGPGEPDVVAAARTAEATFERLGATPFLARLRAAMGGVTAAVAPQMPAATTSADESAGSGVTAGSEHGAG